jgi:hypothetical protein
VTQIDGGSAVAEGLDEATDSMILGKILAVSGGDHICKDEMMHHKVLDSRNPHQRGALDQHSQIQYTQTRSFFPVRSMSLNN